MKKRRKKVEEKVDGLGPRDVRRLVTAVRRVWGWNHARRLCLERAMLKGTKGSDPFSKCEKCGAKVPKLYPDHIKPVGTFMPETFILRMFVSSNQLQAICKKCHRLKTNMERTALRKKSRKGSVDLGS